MFNFFLEIVRTLTRTNGGPPLELVCHCDVTYPDKAQEQPPNIFEDGLEEEAVKRECMSDCHSGKHQRN